MRKREKADRLEALLMLSGADVAAKMSHRFESAKAEADLLRQARAKRRAQQRVRPQLPAQHPLLDTDPVLLRLRESSYERARSDIFHNPHLLLVPGFLETLEHLDRFWELKSEVLVRWVMNGQERAAMCSHFRESRKRQHCRGLWWFDDFRYFAEKLADLVSHTGSMADLYDDRVFSDAAHTALREQHHRDLCDGAIARVTGRHSRVASKIPLTKSKYQKSKRARKMGW
jgi:hypothetical protein